MEEIWKAIPQYSKYYDASSLGRIRRSNGNTKLSVENIEEAKKLRAQGVPFHKIGEMFGVSGPTIYEAIHYKHTELSRRIPNRIRKKYMNKKGYYVVNLSQKGIVRTHHVGNLVAAAFLGLKPVSKQVDHINHDSSDDRLENLRYVSCSENLLNRVIRCPWCSNRLHFNGKKA